MQTRGIQVGRPGHAEDWHGNNAAFACPVPRCGKVYIVSTFPKRDGRTCPACGASKAFVTGSQSAGGKAWVEWDDPTPSSPEPKPQR